MQSDCTKSSFMAYDLRVMGLLRPTAFISSCCPELSWKLRSDYSGFRQGAYRIRAASSKEKLMSAPDLWDTGRIESEECIGIVWKGLPLQSRSRVYWTVTVWDQNGCQSTETETSFFEVALLRNNEWKANWIYLPPHDTNCSNPCPYFRRTFSVNKKVVRARLYVTARGLFEVIINGNRIGDDHFVPGWTDFNKQIQYMSYDITDHIQKDKNAIGAVIGDGWYCGILTNQRRRNTYGKYPEFLAQLELIYSDGTTDCIVTDKQWKSSTGPILYSDIYDGEWYDARLEIPGWSEAHFDDSSWSRVEVGEKAADSPPLVAKVCPPVRRIMEIKPVQITNPQKDTYIWDFGQNISGRLKIRIKGYHGGLCTLNFAEMLNADGTLYNKNYRSARCTDFYTCPGPLEQQSEWWEPKFTFHGFRYAQIDGFQYLTGSLSDVEVVAVVLHSDLEKTGSFACGVEKINRLYSNIFWSQRGNFLEIPTDCPQRDERLGWTGDAAIFAETACCNMNVDAFFRKWMRDVRDAQREDGAVTCCAPSVLPFGFGAAGWADAVLIIPYTIYKRYADKRILEENYDAMKGWIDYQKTTSVSLVRPEMGFGDWLSSDPIKTPSSLIGTAYFAFTTRLFATIAGVLGREEDAAAYSILANEVKAKFRQQFLDENGILKVKNQTSCALAIVFELLTLEERAKNGALLKNLVEANNNRLSTGFIGTGCLLAALTQANNTKTAYDLLLQEEYPSWLYSVNQGATTVWERWNSFSIEKGFGDVRMNSFNHYAYGAVASWMIATAGGIDYRLPAGKDILFAAFPDKRLKFVKAKLETPYGAAESYWRYDKDWISWRIIAPANTSMTVLLPTGSPQMVRMNGKPLQTYNLYNHTVELKLQSGAYEFQWCAHQEMHSHSDSREVVPESM